MNSSDRFVGHREFVDSQVRPVYEDPGGRQYVIGDDGERVAGVWVPPADEPSVVPHSAPK
jgi:hypothetical protein